MNQRALFLVLVALIGFPSTAGARSPARDACTLTNAQAKKALAEVRKEFPQVTKATSCRCNFATKDCTLLDVTFAPVVIEAKKSNVTFNLTVEDKSVRLKKPKSILVEDEPTLFDFERAAAEISKLRVKEVLFGKRALVCDARQKFDSLSFACGEEEPRKALGGGRPGYGAEVFSVHFDRKGKPTVATIAGPVDVVKKLDDLRWLRVSDNPEVVEFLKTHPKSTIALMRTEVAIVAPPAKDKGVATGDSLIVRPGKGRPGERPERGPRWQSK